MKYEERIIAFIDILGFKNLVNDDTKCEDIGAILKLPYLIRQDDMAKMLKIKDVMMNSISDSLVFSIGVKKRGAMNKITKLLSVIMITLLSQYNLLIRGSIAVGKLYHDSDVVYGPGLVKAYELENNIAIYPRIIMTHTDFERSILSCSEVSQSVLKDMFIPDKDGFLYFDCFYYTKQQTLDLCHYQLELISTSDLKIQQKINWMMASIDKKLQEKTL